MKIRGVLVVVGKYQHITRHMDFFVSGSCPVGFQALLVCCGCGCGTLLSNNCGCNLGLYFQMIVFVRDVVNTNHTPFMCSECAGQGVKCPNACENDVSNDRGEVVGMSWPMIKLWLCEPSNYSMVVVGVLAVMINCPMPDVLAAAVGQSIRWVDAIRRN